MKYNYIVIIVNSIYVITGFLKGVLKLWININDFFETKIFNQILLCQVFHPCPQIHLRNISENILEILGHNFKSALFNFLMSVKTHNIK